MGFVVEMRNEQTFNCVIHWRIDALLKFDWNCRFQQI